jgi:hypothetical protein
VSGDRPLTERELIEAHTIRRRHGPKRFGDGLPEMGTPEYEALDYAERLQLCELRSGIFRAPSDEPAGAIPTVPPRRYGRHENNPLDAWKDV